MHKFIFRSWEYFSINGIVYSRILFNKSYYYASELLTITRVLGAVIGFQMFIMIAKLLTDYESWHKHVIEWPLIIYPHRHKCFGVISHVIVETSVNTTSKRDNTFINCFSQRVNGVTCCVVALCEILLKPNCSIAFIVYSKILAVIVFKQIWANDTTYPNSTPKSKFF